MRELLGEYERHPEPGAFGLLASSLGGLILMLRRRRK